MCMGILPLGCAPRILWERDNATAVGDCVEEINLQVLEYNTMLEERIVELNSELFEAQIIFCDVYQGIMQIINDPTRYGIKLSTTPDLFLCIFFFKFWLRLVAGKYQENKK